MGERWGGGGRRRVGNGMWGRAEKRLGVTLSCQLVLGANTRVMQRKIKGRSEIQEILALSFVNGGIVSVCERCCRPVGLDFFHA